MNSVTSFSALKYEVQENIVVISICNKYFLDITLSHKIVRITMRI